MGAFGGSLAPSKLIVSTGAASQFPRAGGTYTAAGGIIVLPHGWGNSWWLFNRARSAQVRGEVVIYGDSTTFGSGPTPSYSWVQRLRDRAVASGYTDGGKGVVGTAGENGIGYDSPEVNAFVSSSTFTGTPDFSGTMTNMWFDNGATASRQLNLQFRGSCVRLGYNQRGTNGSFTYSLDGATAVTVDASGGGSGNIDKFLYFSGLNPATTHTINIVNITLGSHCYINLAPMYDTGVVFHKWAQSGMTFGSQFFAGSPTGAFTGPQEGQWYQQVLGLAPTTVSSPLYAGAPVDTTVPAAGPVKPVLAMTELGFNDLTSNQSYGLTYWTEYVRRFAGACRSAGIGGVVLAGNLPYNGSWYTAGIARYNILKDEAYAQGLAFADLFYPVGGASLSYAGGATNPHLTKVQYVAQADWLWDSLLGLT